MTDITVTINVADFTETQFPAVAVARIARAVIDTSGTVIVSTAQTDVALINGVGIVTLEAGTAYRWSLFGVQGMDTPWYATHTADCTAAELYRLYQVDPMTLAPLPSYPTVGAAIAAVQASVTALQTQLNGVVAGAPTLLATLAELATAVGNDPNYSVDVAAQIASLTNQVAGITLASLGGLSQSQVDARVSALADLKGAAAAITLGSLGGITPAGVDSKIAALSLGSASTHAASDFDAAGSAAAVGAAASATYVPFGPTAPDHTIAAIWVDTSAVPQVLKGWNGSAWVALSTSSGTTYLPLGVDTDGVFYYQTGAYVNLDTDGVPYYTASPDSSSKAVLLDTDGVPYVAA